MAQLDPLLRDSQDHNQGRGRAAILTGGSVEKMLLSSFRYLVESNPCVFRNEVPVSLLEPGSLP